MQDHEHELRVPEHVKDKPAKMLTIHQGRMNDVFRAVEELRPHQHREPVTIATAVYNTHPLYLSHLFHSIRRQNYPAIERVLVVDDGSDDAETKKYLAMVDRESGKDGKWARFEVQYRKHRGAAACYNVIFKSAKTNWTALVGSDDAYSYDYINTIMTCVNPEIMAMGTFCTIIDEAFSPDTRPIRKWPVMGAPIYNMDIFRKHDVWFDEHLKKWIDEDHYQRLNKKLGSEQNFRVIREFLYYYRFHGTNITERIRELETLKIGRKAMENARRMAVGSFVHEDVARAFANVMKASYVTPDGEITEYKAICWFGFNDPGLGKMFPQLKATGMTTILYWFPEDIEHLDYDPKIRNIIASDVDINLAQDVATKKALNQRGITAEVLNVALLGTPDQSHIFRQRFHYLAFGMKQTVGVD